MIADGSECRREVACIAFPRKPQIVDVVEIGKPGRSVRGELLRAPGDGSFQVIVAARSRIC